MQIRNWDKWQTFRKDRGAPPWIKIYRNLLSNEEWVSLSDADKGHLISIWILAADKNGVIPDNPKMIQRMCMLETLPNINKFIELGFLTSTCQPPDNHENKLCPQLDSPEQSRAEQSRVKQIRLNLFEKAWGIYEKKGNRKTSESRFLKLKESDIGKLFIHLPKYVESTPDKQFRKGFQSYLNLECWNDEIITSTSELDFKNKGRDYQEFPA